MSYKSVQTIIAYMPLTSDNYTFDLNFPVDVGKSYVEIQVRNKIGESTYKTEAGDYMFFPELTTIVSSKYTKVKLERYYNTAGGKNLYVKITVVELTTGSVTFGTTTITSTTQDVPVSNYTAGHTFSIAYYWSDKNSWDGDMNEPLVKHKVYNNEIGDVIRLRTDLSAAVDKVFWQVINIPEAQVQLVEHTTGDNVTEQHTLSIEVNPLKTMVYSSVWITTPSTVNMEHLKGCRLYSSTELRLFSYTASVAEVIAYVITSDYLQLKDRVQSSWTGSSTAISLSNNAHKDRSFTHFTTISCHWAMVDSSLTYFGDFGIKATLITLSGDNYTQYLLERGSTSGQLVSYYLEVVELVILADRGRDLSRYRKGYNIGYKMGNI